MKVTAIGYRNEVDKHFQINAEAAFWKQLDEFLPGKYQITVEKYKKVATHQQFKYLYSVVYPLSLLALNNAGYEFTNIDETDIFWKSMFAAKEFVNRENGEIMKLPLSKSEFMTVDENAYCDAIRNYCSEFLNTNIPDPIKDWKRQKEISRRKNGDFQI
jgi:hypothetical protein